MSEGLNEAAEVLWERFVALRKDIGTWKPEDFNGVKAIFESPVYSLSLKKKIADYIFGHFEKMKEGAITVLESQLARNRHATGIGTVVRETLTLVRAIDVLRPVMRIEEPEELTFNVAAPEPAPEAEDPSFNELMKLAERNRQLLLMGPPGVGKTHYAMWCAYKLTKENKEGNWLLVQFHQSYRYEDFIERVAFGSGPNGLRTTPKPMVFLKICRIAEKNPDKNYVLVTDEINRAELPVVFGELLYALEFRGKEVRLAHSGQPFKVPENLYLIGTANSIDRGTFELGVADRRRFKIIQVEPDDNKLKTLLEKSDVGTRDLAIEIFSRVNSICETRLHQKAIGHLFFKDVRNKNDLRVVWKYAIKPLLISFFGAFPETQSLIQVIDTRFEER